MRFKRWSFATLKRRAGSLVVASGQKGTLETISVWREREAVNRQNASQSGTAISVISSSATGPGNERDRKPGAERNHQRRPS